jgi:hypothetical protein
MGNLPGDLLYVLENTTRLLLIPVASSTTLARQIALLMESKVVVQSLLNQLQAHAWKL